MTPKTKSLKNLEVKIGFIYIDRLKSKNRVRIKLNFYVAFLLFLTHWPFKPIQNPCSDYKFCSTKDISGFILREFKCQLLGVNSIFSTKRTSSHLQSFPEASV